MIKRLIILITDIAIAVSLLLGIWIYYYKAPHYGVHAVPFLEDIIYQDESSITYNSSGNNYPTTRVIAATEDWHQKFADHFSDTVIITDNEYKSPNLSIELSYGTIETNRLDMSEKGKHKKYGTKITYTLADIYIGNIKCIQTAFAQDTYGVGYSEKLTDMSARLKSVLAINGDSYSNNRHRNNVTIIRNGVIYRNAGTDM